MAIDINKLEMGLRDYREALVNHVGQLRPEFDELKERWKALGQSYEGNSADEMYSRWGQTAEWIDEYLNNVSELESFLEERLEHLRTL